MFTQCMPRRGQEPSNCRWPFNDPPLGRSGDTGVVARGVVKFFKSEKGWGAIGCASSQMARTPLSTSRTSKRLVTARWKQAMASTSTTRQLGRTASTSGQPEPGVWSQTPAPVLRRTGTRGVIAPVGTPDTPMTQRRHRLADGLTPDSSDPDPAG